jgi:hypothetical protein
MFELVDFSLFQFSDESLKKYDIKVKDNRELVSLINESIVKKCARTTKDKMELLDLRDKILKLIRNEINNLTTADDLSNENTIGLKKN